MFCCGGAVIDLRVSLYVKCDATQKDSLEQAFQEVKSKLGSVEVFLFALSCSVCVCVCV